MPTIAVTVVDQTVGVTQAGEIGPVGPSGTVSAAGNGTAALPAIAFASDLDTGFWRVGANIIGVSTAGSERVRIDASGNVGITQGDAPTQALSIYRAGASGTYMSVGISSTGLDGGLFGVGADGAVEIRSSTVNQIGLWTNGSRRVLVSSTGVITPGADNTQNFGSGSLRWATIFAGTGTINTSDERYKVLREGGDLSDAEYRAWSNIRAIVYQEKESLERKGGAARLHIGYSWQAIQAAFEAEGLDPSRYGLWCEDPLMAPVEKTRMATRSIIGDTDASPLSEDFEETYTEMEPTGETRGSLRYSQCSVIEAAWLRRELASLTARIAALEQA
jgi:hypothetical protein